MTQTYLYNLIRYELAVSEPCTSQRNRVVTRRLWSVATITGWSKLTPRKKTGDKGKGTASQHSMLGKDKGKRATNPYLAFSVVNTIIEVKITRSSEKRKERAEILKKN